MVISQVDTDEVVERWQFDIHCENTAKSVDEKGEKWFASATIIGLFQDKGHFRQIFLSLHSLIHRVVRVLNLKFRSF